MAACEMSLHGQAAYNQFVAQLLESFSDRPMLKPSFPTHPEAVAVLMQLGESYISTLPGSNSSLVL